MSLRHLRAAAGFSQEKLAKAAGVSCSTIKRLELGWGGTNSTSLARIARVLRVNPGDLLAKTVDKQTKKTNRRDDG